MGDLSRGKDLVYLPARANAWFENARGAAGGFPETLHLSWKSDPSGRNTGSEVGPSVRNTGVPRGSHPGAPPTGLQRPLPESRRALLCRAAPIGTARSSHLRAAGARAPRAASGLGGRPLLPRARGTEDDRSPGAPALGAETCSVRI